MAAFDPEDPEGEQPDVELFRLGHVVLFGRLEVLEGALADLRRLGYRVVVLDAGAWRTSRDMHEAVAGGLGFPEWYGRNLDALVDCLGDVADYGYGTTPEDTGLVLVLTGFDAFARREPHDAQQLTEIFTLQARGGMLFGHRMICLLQVDDPEFALAPVGAVPVNWNSPEWRARRRSRG